MKEKELIEEFVRRNREPQWVANYRKDPTTPPWVHWDNEVRAKFQRMAEEARFKKLLDSH